MDTLSSQLASRLEEIAAASSVVATVLALMLSVLARYGSDLAQKLTRIQPVAPHAPTHGKGIHQVTVWNRLAEAEAVHKKQKRLGRIYGLANAVLVAGQYIVGGLLASSFLQENLSKEQIGLFGLVVLASSIINQHFKPGVLSVRAKTVAANLKKTIRDAEDRIALLDPTSPDTSVLHNLQVFLSSKLSEVETLELQLAGPTGIGEEPRRQPVKAIQAGTPAKEGAANTHTLTSGDSAR